MEITSNAKFTIFNKKATSIQTIQSDDYRLKRQISPQQTGCFFQTNQQFSSMNVNEEKQRIKQLLQENAKLLKQCSQKDLQIVKLQAQLQNNMELRTQRIQTLNSEQKIEKKNNLFDNTQNISNQNEDKYNFTFYSPESKQNFQVFKLPKVFRAFPKQNKYYI